MNFTNIYCHFLFLLLPAFHPPLPTSCLGWHHQVCHFFLAFASFLSLGYILGGKKVIDLGAGFLHLATVQISLLMQLPKGPLSSSWWSCPTLHWWKVTLAVLTQPVLAFPQHLSLLATAMCQSSTRRWWGWETADTIFFNAVSQSDEELFGKCVLGCTSQWHSKVCQDLGTQALVPGHFSLKNKIMWKNPGYSIYSI